MSNRGKNDFKGKELESGEKLERVRCRESSKKLDLPEKSVIVGALDTSCQTAGDQDGGLDYTINKLDQLISDPITRDNTSWIGRLLKIFLRQIQQNGYVSFYRQLGNKKSLKIFRTNDSHQMVEHLDLVSRLLKFVASRSKDVAEYEILLEKMLELCRLRPILKKTSDSLRYKESVELYFSTLGHLTKLLDTDRQISMLLDAILNILDEKQNNDKLATTAFLKLENCHETIEKSTLPIFITELLKFSSSNVYDRTLDVVFVLVTISTNCCYKMMKAGILDNLFVRMSDQAESDTDVRAACSKEQLFPELDTQLRRDKIALTSNIAWNLMRSIQHQQKSKKNHVCTFEKLSVPSIDAMRSLRNVFRSQVIQSRRGNAENRVLRNDLAVLILAGLAARPSWHLIRCGLAEDLVILSLADQSEIEANNENLMFRKILLTILYHLSNRGAAIAIMAKRRVIPTILEMINPSKIENGTRRSASMSQFWYLSEFAMRTLGKLAKKMPEEFIQSEGPTRLSMFLEWSLTVEFDTRLTMELSRTICAIATSDCRSILINFAAEGLVPILFKIVRRILSFDSLSMQHQRILTLLITTIEEISMTEGDCVRSCDSSTVETIIQLLHRCFQRKSKQDFQLDQRLLVAIGSYIWQCIARSPETSDKFVEDGGIYAILDVIEEQASFNARCVFLGILADMVVDGYGAPHLSTWRGADKTTGFVSLLGKCWREEEIRTGVKRTVDGCIDDVELPIMGTEQWINTFHARSPSRHFSPALGSLLASVRPKIYCLRKIITSETRHPGYRQSREHYKILADDTSQLPLQDRMTMYVADHFYRFVQGELWAEVSHNLEQSGLNVLGMDGEIIQLMNHRHRDWGMYVHGLQKELLRAEKKREAERERDEIGKIRDSRLTTALSALNDIDYIRRTTDRDYMLKVNKMQRERANETLKFPTLLSDRELCHRTFNQRFNFTTILDQNHTVPSAYGLANFPDVKLTPVRPASPVNLKSGKLFDSVTHGLSP